jgi:uncharacterized protein (DUF302 family)
MVELTASGDADQVEARLREALDAHGLQLFARIDHAAGARKADVDGHQSTLEWQAAVLAALAAAAAG